MRLGIRDVLGDRTVEEKVVLQHDAQVRTVLAQPHVGQILTVDEHATRERPVEGHHEAD